MSCVEKRHMSHRMGSMLHHRFPNGFTDLFMDDTDREVSTLTDRAFRSLCVGDDAVYNDEFLYGYSPFSCHKPLVGEPVKKTHNKDSKKQGQNKTDKNYTHPWNQQQQKNISHMSSFLKAFSATEESCDGMLIKNGVMTDIKGESWDKSALRSIQRELSEFSSDYPTNLTDGHYKNCHRHHSGDGPSNKAGKDAALPSGKSSKTKNGKSTVKLRKLNIKNFFLHSELSPFQAWRDFNRFPFGQQDAVLPTDSIPKWYDLPFYKELTEAHRQETQHAEEAQPCQKAAVEHLPSPAPKPIPPPPPPKVLPKPSAAPAEKRCSSDGGDGITAPWRRNKSRAKSVIPVNQSGKQSKDSGLKTMDESLFLVKKEARSVEVKAVEEVSSLASTPFSICQLMTPLIPSRQPTETSEILQGVLSPSALDLPLRPHSEAKMTSEPPVKRDSYKSLASSILFNLKDNRKRVKSRYSPPKFKTLELPESGTQSPQSDYMKNSQAGSEGNASRLSTPAISKDGLAICSPVLESNSSPNTCITVQENDRPLSDDYLLSNLLQTKREVAGNGEEYPMSPLLSSKKNRSPMAKKQNYPSLNLYKKATPVDSDTNYLHVPPKHIDQPSKTIEHSPLAINKELSPNALPINTGLSPNSTNVSKDRSPLISPNVLQKDGSSPHVTAHKVPPVVPDKAKRLVKEITDTEFGSKEKDNSAQPISTKDVIRAAREAINAAKNRALLVTQTDISEKTTSENETDNWTNPKEVLSNKSLARDNKNTLTQRSQSRNEATETLAGRRSIVKKEPPPVPKRNFTKSDIQFSLDKQPTPALDKLTNGDSENPKQDIESLRKQAKLKHVFSARQNNYIKNQRYADTDDEQGEEFEEVDMKVSPRLKAGEEMVSPQEMRDSEHIINDLNALKELERARLGDRINENTKNKLGVNIDEVARAKNDLISRELRNIKKGMLSMRGNTSAKRDLFARKEKEQSNPEAFTKIDSNVIVNKALINDNYDKAKMALEEIISERQKRNVTEQDDKASDESHETKLPQRKAAMKDTVKEARDNSVKETDLKERLGDLRDHNHMRHILSQTEPGLGEAYKTDGRIAVPRKNSTGYEPTSLLKTQGRYSGNKLANDLESEEKGFRNVERQLSKDSEENWMHQNGDKGEDAPLVPPRSKKGGNRRDGSVTEETDGQIDLAEEGVFKNEGEVPLFETSTGSGKQEEAAPSHSEPSSCKGRWDTVNNANSKISATDAFKRDSVEPVKSPQVENALCLSPELITNENKANKLQADVSPTKEATFESSINKPQEPVKVKRRAPLRPDHLNTIVDNTDNHLMEAEKMNKTSEDIRVDAEVNSETPEKVLSPILMVNGVSINQSPPDHASLSSKSSYFSVESALHRNIDPDSNVYNSLENLIGEVDNPMQNFAHKKRDSDRTEYYSFSDHESEPESVKLPKTSPKKEDDAFNKYGKEEAVTADPSSTQDEDLTPLSPSNMFSPNLGIPALFKVKDNTFSNKLKKSIQPWPPRGSLSGPTKGEEELHQAKEVSKLPPPDEPSTTGMSQIPDEFCKPKEVSSNTSPGTLLSPSIVPTGNQQKPQSGMFLTVPQDEDRFSGVSPSSEGVESVTTSAVDTADEMATNDGLPVERDVTKVHSERSGSTCSGNDSQTGLPKPPAVLPKSEKAVLKAIKLANKRMKKEEAQKSSHKSSQGSGKQKADRHRSDKSEHKSSSSRRNNKSSERKHVEKTEERHHGKNSNDSSDQVHSERGGHNRETNSVDKKNTNQKTQEHSRDSVESNNHHNEAPPSVPAERQGRSNIKSSRDKPQQRHYSSDRVISNVPVYKAYVGDRPTPERLLQRSFSSDRCLGDKVERRLSTDMSVNERLDPRSQRIEKSIMDEFQQRGRARDKASRENPLRRSHSIDAYSTEVPHPSTLSRQSSHTSHSSQLSRQSSIEHAIVTQSFPMTQRKLLQDPDSGQYFFVDMPVQVKTKTFFDPETGSYVQLPVQPPEGAVPQASPLEVLTPPMVLYHGFVPVPLSPMAQKATIQAPHVAPEEFDQRHLERSRQMHCKDRHPYLEPVYGQHDLVLGEFLGTEELDCPS